MVYSDKQIETANKLLPKYEANINFIEERIRIQKQEGFSRIGLSGASIRTYSHLDIEIYQNKIDFILANLEETKIAREIKSAEGSANQFKYEQF